MVGCVCGLWKVFICLLVVFKFKIVWNIHFDCITGGASGLQPRRSLCSVSMNLHVCYLQEYWVRYSHDLHANTHTD